MWDPKIPPLLTCCKTRHRLLSKRRRRLPLLSLVAASTALLYLNLRNVVAWSPFQRSFHSRRAPSSLMMPTRDIRPIAHASSCPSRIRLFMSTTTDNATTESSTGASDEQETPTFVPANGLVNGEVHPSANGAAMNQTLVNGLTDPNSNNNNNNTSATPDIPLPTANGGYSHTTASKKKISQANKGKVPWNKGRKRSPQEKERIAAGVRARNRQRFLEKLQTLGLTEEEYNEKKKQERRKRDQERRARKTAKGGYRPTKETKEKISAILKEKWAKGEIKKGKVNPQKVRRGFTHSAETRAKISASLKKKWAEDVNYRDNMLEKCNSSHGSQETKQRISASLRQKWQDPEFRGKMLQKMANRKQQPSRGLSHREKISAAMKKKWQDEEYRSKTIAGIQKHRNATAAQRKSTTAASAKPKPSPKGSAAVPLETTNDSIRIATPVQPKQASKKSSPTKKQRSTTTSLPKATTAAVPLETTAASSIRIATPVQPKQASKKSSPVKKKRAKRSRVQKKQPSPKATVDTNAELVNNVMEAKKAAAIQAEPDGSINRLREERRDLYDLLYGDDGSSSVALDLGDENLDTFDPYGLEDF